MNGYALCHFFLRRATNRLGPTVRQNKLVANCNRARQGFSLVEVAISTLLVGLLIVGALECSGNLLIGRGVVSDRAIANQLAQQLMCEICNTQYIDDGPLPLFGPEELFGRSQYDDVDDYRFWSASPPEDRQGNPIPGRSGWNRTVSVEWVDPAQPANTAGSDYGLKRITVVASKQGETLAVHVAIRSREMDP